MAFINISNPQKRKEIVQEYIKTRNELQLKAENKKEGNLLKEQAIQEQAKPVVTATKESAEKITSALNNFNNNNFNTSLYSFYSKLNQNKDKYFSIYQTDKGTYKLGNSDIGIDNQNNIFVNGKTYHYTPGLWNLLMLNKPDNYDSEDYNNYTELVKSINLIDNPQTLIPQGVPKMTSKYKFLVKLLVGRKRKREDSDNEEITEENEQIDKKDGEGIILPGDINGLLQRLRLVCAEREAGNIEATTPEIVAILDELLRKQYISKKEYNVVCKKLEC